MEASDFTGHISRRFNRDIEDLRNSVLAMGGLVENQLSKAVSAIISGDSELGLRVANDDYMVNDLEVSIDEECGRILATRSPAASARRAVIGLPETSAMTRPSLSSLSRNTSKKSPPTDSADAFSNGAVAVVPVVLYHLDIPQVPGGFVGVDVFFV